MKAKAGRWDSPGWGVGEGVARVPGCRSLWSQAARQGWPYLPIRSLCLGQAGDAGGPRAASSESYAGALPGVELCWAGRVLHMMSEATERLVFVKVWLHPATMGTDPCKNCLVLWSVLMMHLH